MISCSFYIYRFKLFILLLSIKTLDKGKFPLIGFLCSEHKKVLGERNFTLTDFFIENTYTTNQNKVLPCYLLTKKGCDMVANKLTGEKGIYRIYLFTSHQKPQS